MTSRLELQYRYPEPPQRMLEVLTDPTFLRDKLSAVGGPSAELVSRDQSDRVITIVLHQKVPADAVPSFIRSMLPGDLTIRRTESWTGERGTVQAVIEGAPGTITGRMSLGPDTNGSVFVLDLESRVPLPLFGGKVEKAVTDGLGRLMDTEYNFTLQWLRRSETA